MESPLREFEPLNKLLKSIPNKIQRAFKSQSIEWTALDVTEQYAAVGSNVGVVFLYDRSEGRVQRLETQNPNDIITTIQMCQSVDYLVAVGTATGYVCIFQLPSILTGRNKQLQKFEVCGSHHSRVKCLHWSRNAMKLFSGDEDGIVTCTEFDYEKSTSHSYFVHKEAHEIVQLDYGSRLLLISTRFRSLVHNTADSTQQQIGSKDRKVLGHFGAVFLKGAYHQSEKVLFATRPAFRLWKALASGPVNATYIYKDLMKHQTEGIVLLGDSLAGCMSQPADEKQFGPLLLYKETLLVSYNDSSLYVMDPGLGSFVGYHSNLGKILHVAVCKDEIFILRREGTRKILRIAQSPDPYECLPIQPPVKGTSITTSLNGNTPQRPIDLMTHTASSLFGAVKGMSDKLRTSVQEGQKAKSPPWGVVGQPSFEEGKELNSSESPSPVKIPQAIGEHHNKENEIEVHPSENQHNDSYTVGFVMEPQNRRPFETKNYDETNALSNESAPGAPKGRQAEVDDHPGAPPLLDEDIAIHVKTKRKGKKKKGKDKDTTSISSFELQSSTQSSEILTVVKSTEQPTEGILLDDAKGQRNDRFIDQNTEPLTYIRDEHDKESLSEQIPLDPKLKAKLILANVESDSKSDTSSFYDAVEDVSKQDIEKSSELNPEEKAESLHNSVENKDRDFSECTYKTGTYVPEVEQRHSTIKSGNVKESDEVERKSYDPTSKEQKNAKDVENVQDDSSHFNWQDVHTSASSSAQDFDIHSKHLSSSKPLPELKTNSDISNSFSDYISKTSSVGSHSKDNNSKEPNAKTESKSHGPKDQKEQITTPKSKDTSFKLHPKSGAGSRSNSEDADDFYSKYASPTSPLKSPIGKIGFGARYGGMSSPDVSEEDGRSLQDALDYEAAVQRSESLNEEEDMAEEGLSNILANTWNEFTVPGHLKCVCVTHRHVWIVDTSERLHYSFLEGPGLKFHRVDVSAQQISVAPSGSIVWRMYRGTLYAGTKITTRAPYGLKWEDFVESGVAHISVDENMGWYVKTSGELIMHKNLTRERPCYTPQKVDCKDSIVKVACHKSVVWALTEDRTLIVRMGISKGREEGDSWHYLGSGGPSQLVADFDLGEEDSAWVVDVVGRLWFMTGVTASKPQGDGQWWQVSLTEYLMQDATALGILKTITDYPQKLLQYVQQSDGGGLVSARCNGIWACTSQKNILHVCKGGLLGHRWETLSLPGIAPLVTWKHVSASGLTESEGNIWTQQPNGGIFCFNPQSSARVLKVIEVTPPEPEAGVPVQCMSVVRDVVWVLMPKGKVYLRAGIHSSCPQGVKWVALDLTQLGRKTQFAWLCCGGENVWAVDNKGKVHLRIGIAPPSNQLLNPAWVPVDGVPQTVGAKFVKVATGPQDWMVWAIDSAGCVYVRKGVTDTLPVGSHWVYVPGTMATDLTVSENYVYALTPSSEIYVRCHITEDNVMGNCWSKIPGVLSCLSAAHEGDGLWGINRDGQLCRRFTHFLNKKRVLQKLSEKPESPGGDWELL